MTIAEELDSIFASYADPQKASAMQKYMKDSFAYYGINSPLRKQLTKDYFREKGYPKAAEASRILGDLWAYDEREMQYVGIDLTRRLIKKQEEDFIKVLEQLILKKSWWDTVDALSVDAGTHLLRYPDLQPNITNRWISHDNFWLQRAAIIHQLMYKEKTNWEMLTDYILRVAHDKEFFLRKACGWALRQYSKTAPDRVRDFLMKYRDSLSGLTIREGSKYIKME